MTGILIGSVVFAAVMLWGRLVNARPRGAAQSTPTEFKTRTNALVAKIMRKRGSAASHEGLSQVSFVAASVSARLQAGASVTSAWQLGLEPVNPQAAQQIHDGLDVAAVLRDVASSQREGNEAKAWLTLARMTALAIELGAPLAEALDHCAQGLDEQQAAAAARRVAFAGPRSSARLLSWLPVGGLGLGMIMGVDPIAVLVDGSWGTICGVLGVALIGIGRLWTSWLIRRAEYRSL